MESGLAGRHVPLQPQVQGRAGKKVSLLTLKNENGEDQEASHRVAGLFCLYQETGHTWGGLTDTEQAFWSPKGKGRGQGKDREFGMTGIRYIWAG